MRNKSAVGENKVSSFVSNVANVLGILSFFIAVVPAISAFMTKNIFAICGAAVSFLIAFLVFFKRKKIARSLLHFFLNLTSPQKPYKLTQKLVIYDFVERTKMRHEKAFYVKVLHTSFTGINDKYKWTGEAPLTVTAKDPARYHIEPLGSKFGLERYNIVMNGDKKFSVGDTFEMVSCIDEIEDLSMKSSLHLSSGIYERTDCLVLKVLFNPNLQPINARCLEYIHYNDDYHYKSENLEAKLDGSKKCLEWIVKKPLHGAKYMIEWEF